MFPKAGNKGSTEAPFLSIQRIKRLCLWPPGSYFSESRLSVRNVTMKNKLLKRTRVHFSSLMLADHEVKHGSPGSL